MEIGQVQFIVAWVSIIGTTLGGMFAAFMFLHREMREGFKRQAGEVKELRSDVTDLKVSVARIEGHLGIGFPSADEPREPSESTITSG